MARLEKFAGWKHDHIQSVQSGHGRIETRRIAVPMLARELPYPIYHAYLLLDEQTPAADPTCRSTWFAT